MRHPYRWTLGCVLIALVVFLGWWRSPSRFQRLRHDVHGMAHVWVIDGFQARRQGARELVRQRGPRVVPMLIQMLDDDDWDVRGAAASALAMFPERADLSVPALLQQFGRNGDYWCDLNSVKKSLDELLPHGGKIPRKLSQAARSEAPRRRMLAVDLVLRRKPDDTDGRWGLLRSLTVIRDDRTGLLSHEDWSAAHFAIHTLTALSVDDQAFAQVELDRIAAFPPEYTKSFWEIEVLCRNIRTLMDRRKN